MSDFARLEVDFVLLDPRWRKLSHAARSVYLALWVRAVNLRSECLPAYYLQSTLVQDANVSRTTLVRCLKQLQEKLLIKIGEDERITVCGVRSKHQKLRGWKDEDKGNEPRKEREREKEREILKPKETLGKDSSAVSLSNQSPQLPTDAPPRSALKSPTLSVKPPKLKPDTKRRLETRRIDLLKPLADRMNKDAVDQTLRMLGGVTSSETLRVLKILLEGDSNGNMKVNPLCIVGTCLRMENPPAFLEKILRCGGLKFEPSDEVLRWKEAAVVGKEEVK